MHCRIIKASSRLLDFACHLILTQRLCLYPRECSSWRWLLRRSYEKISTVIFIFAGWILSRILSIASISTQSPVSAAACFSICRILALRALSPSLEDRRSFWGFFRTQDSRFTNNDSYALRVQGMIFKPRIMRHKGRQAATTHIPTSTIALLIHRMSAPCCLPVDVPSKDVWLWMSDIYARSAKSAVSRKS